MKVLLVQSYLGLRENPIFPLGLCYIATALRNHTVDIIDPNVEKDPLLELRKKIRDFQPEVVGVSLRNIDSEELFSYFEPFVHTIEVIKYTKADVKIMIGGAGFSVFAEEIMKRIPQIDYGVFLDGEESVPELLDNLQNPESVRGLFIRKNGEIRFTGKRVPPNFSSLPKPQRDLIDINKYKNSNFSIGVQTKRGCVLKCIYCTYPFISGANIRLRPPKEVVDEIEELVNSYNIRNIWFVDDVFNIPLAHAKEICEEIINRGIKIQWNAYFKEKYITEDFMALALKAGCHKFGFSPDAYSDRILHILRKGITKKDIMKTYNIAKKFKGIKVAYNFFLCPPGENLINFVKSMAFLLKTRLILKAEFSLIPIRIYPHTEIQQIAIKEGLINKDMDLLPMIFYSRPSMKHIIVPIYRSYLAVKKILGTVKKILRKVIRVVR